MATVTAYDVRLLGRQAITPTTLTADDDFVLNTRQQVLVVSNTTGGDLTINILGDQATTVACPGVGNVDVSGGFDALVSDGQTIYIPINSIRSYLSDTTNQPNITGGTGLAAYILEF